MLRTRTVSYQNILSDAANLSYYAGKLLIETQSKLKSCSSAKEHDDLVIQCNRQIKQNYIYNLQMLYPGLRIVCQDASTPKSQH